MVYGVAPVDDIQCEDTTPLGAGRNPGIPRGTGVLPFFWEYQTSVDAKVHKGLQIREDGIIKAWQRSR